MSSHGDEATSPGTAPDGTVEEYWYDQNGKRGLIRKTPAGGGSPTFRMFHDHFETEWSVDGGAPALRKTFGYASLGTPVARIQNRNDGIVTAIVRCGHCNSWSYCWLVVHKPLERDRIYAIRSVSTEWVEALISALGQAPAWPRWAPRFNAVTRQAVDVHMTQIGAVPQSLLIGQFDDLLAPPSRLASVAATDLGEWGHARAIEDVISQSQSEANMLRGLLAVK
jgi:hypothetical protein